MIEFVINNNDSAFTRLSLFFTSRGLYLCISFDIIDFLDFIICEQLNNKKATDIFKAM